MQKIIILDSKNIKRHLTGGKKIITLSLGIIIFGLLLSNSAFATTMNTNVNIRPSMTLSVSSNDITLNLNPATKPFENKDLTITIGTNNPTGYKLYLNSNGTDLVNTEDSTKTIETLPSSTPATGYDEASFPANYWGYRKSSDTISSGNYLPYTSELLVSESSTPSNETITTIGLASKIDYLKDSGTYKLNFKLNAIPTITQYYMQDLSDPTLASQVCVIDHPSIVFDSRDEEAYMIQRLPDNRCWMLDNLNLDLTNREIVNSLTAVNTNANSTSLNALVNGGGSDSNGLATSGLTYSNYIGGWEGVAQPLVSTSGTCDSSRTTSPCTYNGSYTRNSILSALTPGTSTYGYGSGKIGIFYNFCAATAGSYCYSRNYSGPSSASYDICPASWRLPTGGTTGEYQALCDAIYGANCQARPTVDSSDVNSFPYRLSLLDAGNYHSSIMYGQGQYGNWWSSTRDTAEKIYLLTLTGKNTEITLQFSNMRHIGDNIRCILKEF